MAKRKVKKPQYAKKPQYHTTISTKTLIGIFAAVIVFVVFIIMWLDALFSPPKTPATADEVWQIIEEQGYKPEDITETYLKNDSDAFLSLIKCIAFKYEDIEFQFFEFNNRGSAIDIYGQAYHNIRMKHNSWQKIEISHEASNYSMYFLDSHGVYNVAIFVENTAVYATCNSENKNEINKILAPIDYLEFGNNKETATTGQTEANVQ